MARGRTGDSGMVRNRTEPYGIARNRTEQGGRDVRAPSPPPRFPGTAGRPRAAAQPSQAPGTLSVGGGGPAAGPFRRGGGGSAINRNQRSRGRVSVTARRLQSKGVPAPSRRCRATPACSRRCRPAGMAVRTAGAAGMAAATRRRRQPLRRFLCVCVCFGMRRTRLPAPPARAVSQPALRRVVVPAAPSGSEQWCSPLRCGMDSCAVPSGAGWTAAQSPPVRDGQLRSPLRCGMDSCAVPSG
eukprot:gene16231-biopygen17242